MSEENPFKMPKVPWPLRPLDWLFSRIADQNLAQARSPVENQKLWLRVQRVALVRYAGVLAVGIALAVVAPTPWWASPLWLILIYIATYGASTHLLQARMYLSGWMGGRHAMVISMQEAVERDMSLVDWLKAESERDEILFLTAHGVTPKEVLEGKRERKEW